MPDPVKQDEEKPVPALDEVGEGPAIPENDDDPIDPHPHIGELVNVNEWGDEIGGES